MLHYSEYGAGRPLIILHGLLGSSENWVRIARELGVYFNVITVDLRNHGMSFHRDEMNYEVMAEDVMALMRYYSWDSPVIMGHSMGGMIVQEMVKISSKSINKLICFGTGSIGDIPGRFESLDKSIERLKEEGIDETVKRIPPKWFVKGNLAENYYLCDTKTRNPPKPNH